MTLNSLEDLCSGKLLGKKQITLRAELTSVPEQICSLKDTLEFLDLSHNKLSSLPAFIGELRNLKVLFLSYNKFIEIPETLRHLPALRMLGMRGNQIEHFPNDSLPDSLIWLTLTENNLSQIPDGLRCLPNLRKVLLAGNQFREVPLALQLCHNLELLRLSANLIEQLPSWLFELPTLAWLAIGGNPATNNPAKPIHTVQLVLWNEIKIISELGRGATGVTYKAQIDSLVGATDRIYAVKVFSRNISSDGAAMDEIAASLQVGEHQNLVSTLALIQDHPDGAHGLVLKLIPDEFVNLAAPPSFETCTRDLYSQSFSAQNVLRIVQDIAFASAHLHQRKICHGDLYAHNILVNKDGSSILGDFGAACSYSALPENFHELVEQVEVRAFGILVEELLIRLVQDPRHNCEVTSVLKMVVSSIKLVNHSSLPLSEIINILNKLS